MSASTLLGHVADHLANRVSFEAEEAQATAAALALVETALASTFEADLAAVRAAEREELRVLVARRIALVARWTSGARRGTLAAFEQDLARLDARLDDLVALLAEVGR